MSDRTFFNGKTLRNEVWLWRHEEHHENARGRPYTDACWLVADIDSQGNCEKHLNYPAARVDYEARIARRDR